MIHIWSIVSLPSYLAIFCKYLSKYPGYLLHFEWVQRTDVTGLI